MSSAKAIQQHLQSIANPAIAKISQNFFKTAPGQYGAGDVFIGIKVPMLRSLVKQYRDASLATIATLLESKNHEQRLFALLLLIETYQRGDDGIKKHAYDLYLAHTAHINNWDLVDVSAPHIVGAYLLERPRKVLYQLVKSESLWERRIAILATFQFIRNDDFDDTLKISEHLLPDEHDLIHKAVGWMLREVGKRDQAVEEKFLQQHYRTMPRTMLRYAIEKFPEPLRKSYLAGTV